VISRDSKLFIPECLFLLQAACVFFIGPAVMAVEPGMVAKAEKGSLPVLEILEDQQVSIADLHEVPISEASGNVYVITDEDIRHSGVTDVPTLLRRIPGIEVMQMTGADFNVSVRGNNQQAANKLLVLVDGRSIYEDAFGSVFWTLLPVTLPEIKRIEVLKGPASAIYGFNAFDGVVNIITKSPDEMKGNTNGTTLQFGGGEFGMIRAAAVQAGTHEKFGYRLSLGRDQNQKWSDRNQLALRAHKFNVQTEYALPGVSKLVFSGGLVDSNRFDGQVFDVVHESSTIANGYANVEYKWPDFFLRANWIRWNENRQELLDPRLAPFAEFTDRGGNINQIFKQDVYNFDGQHAVAFGTSNRLTYGFNYRHNAVSLNVLDEFTRENRFGLYLQDEWRATDSVTVVAGLRWDLHTEINPTYSPRLSLLYKPAQDHTFRISGSIAYRPPNNLETHTDLRTVFPTFGGLTIITRGSENLNAEKIASYEAGYQGWFLKHRLRFRADVFYNHISDFITGASTADPTVFTFSNTGKADIYGGEAGIEFLATTWLTGFANYSTAQLWQSSDLIASGGFLQRGAPPYKASAGLRGEWDNGVSGEAVIHHVSAASYPVSSAFGNFAPLGRFTPPDTRVGSYTLLNLRSAYQFWHERAEVAVAVFNALNDHHRENPIGDPLASRVMGWLTIRY
jgi:iron complex outermembrane recepter protein